MIARLTGRVWCLTFVTVGELTQWMRLRNWSARNQTALEAWLSGFALVDSSHQAAQIWGMLSAEGKRRGRSRPINDTWIAACCLAEGLPLATLNVKDYADFAEHHGLRGTPRSGSRPQLAVPAARQPPRKSTLRLSAYGRPQQRGRSVFDLPQISSITLRYGPLSEGSCRRGWPCARRDVS